MVWQRRLVAPLRRRSFPSTRHQLNLGLVQYFNIFYHKKISTIFLATSYGILFLENSQIRDMSLIWRVVLFSLDISLHLIWFIYICILLKLKISGLIPLVILIFLNLRILSRWSFPPHPHLTNQTQKNTNPETNTHSLPSLISLPFMPCISYNSEKLEESSLPPRVGQEHCQQQFHHRFVCLRLFFPSTVLSFRQTARAKSNPAVSRLQPGHHPHLHGGHVLLVPLAKSRHQVGVLHIIVVTITDTMANNIFTNSIFSIYEAANIHSILDCRERGLPWILYSTKSTRNIMTLICTWKNIVQFYHCREGQDPNLVHVHHQRCSTPHGEWPRLFTIHVTNSKFWYSIVIWKR